MSEYTILRSDDPDAHLADDEDLKGEQTSLALPLPGGASTKHQHLPKSGGMFIMKTSVAVLVLINLLVWVFAITRLRYVAGGIADSLEMTDTRLLPRPGSLGNLLELLATGVEASAGK
ncbi:hypothetical protein VTO73DRAFT_10867 [Trametes versicolor]